MARTAQRFIGRVRRALRDDCGVAAGARLVVACSGGPDSTALLVALCALQGELSLTLHVAHIDHGLRPAAAAEGAQVLRLCADLEVSAESLRVQVADEPSQGGTMAAARRARYDALSGVALAQGAQAVAVGHTRNDQAETVIMRLCGGAGLRGLAGMAARRELLADSVHLQLIRPLLKLDRLEISEFLAAAGLSWCEDPTNADLRYQRSRVRHQILPLLRGERGDLDGHLSQLAEQLRADAEYLDGAAQQALTALLSPRGAAPPSPAVTKVLPAAELFALPLPLSSRVLNHLLGPLSHRHVQEILLLCRSTEGSAAVDLPGGRVERRYGELHLRPAPPAALQARAIPVPGPGEYPFAGGVLSLTQHPSLATAPDPALCFDAALPFPLHLRTPLPGDRMQVRGMAGHKKLSDLLIDEKVPRWQRAAAPLLCHGDDILCVAGLRAAAAFPPGDGPVLQASWSPER